MGCEVDQRGNAANPPPSVQAEQVTIRHAGGQRLEISLDFLESVPAEPRAVTGPYGGVRSAPGSLTYSILVRPNDSPEGRPFLVISSPEPAIGGGWRAELVSSLDESNTEALQSVTTSGKTLTVVVDFGGQTEVLGPGRFKANVSIVMLVSDTQTDSPIILKSQECAWDNSITSTATQLPTTSPASPPQVPPDSANTGQTPPDTQVSPPTGTVKSVTATSRIQWSGSRCIDVRSARRDNKTQSVTDSVCSRDGTWRYSEEATTGQLVGGDPIMGDADSISCQLYINGQLEFSDKADAGDGTDVNCLRTVN
jgi:hypothetical protein